MYDTIRESPFGQIARFVTGRKVFLYPEEKGDFGDLKLFSAGNEFQNSGAILSTEVTNSHIMKNDGDEELDHHDKPNATLRPNFTKDGILLVEWYGENDPANPQNWSSKKKAFVAFQICFYTFAVYTGSSIYVSSEL
jgi:MFS transporter, DHA1 family, multidrug resistance protein